MQSAGNIFEGKQVRALQDIATGEWWFSAVDICGVLIGSDYETARTYWKHLKSDLFFAGSQLVGKTDQLKLKSRDGKLRYTDVLDIKQVLYLIQIIPKKEAEPFRLWLVEAAVEGTVVQQLVALGERNVEKTLDEVVRGDEKVVDRVTVVRRVLFEE
ncbi:MAG: hypothetical protein FWD03_03625 [Defluviitaleaceae bacterium]|nr:hypothetical protein [Defluviitaleaceae bacterium]